jgi:hypothetical protein
MKRSEVGNFNLTTGKVSTSAAAGLGVIKLKHLKTKDFHGVRPAQELAQVLPSDHGQRRKTNTWVTKSRSS